MENVGRFRLTQLSKEEMERRKLNFLRGGRGSDCCGCNVCDESQSTNSNFTSNVISGSSGGGNKYCWDPDGGPLYRDNC